MFSFTGILLLPDDFKVIDRGSVGVRVCLETCNAGVKIFFNVAKLVDHLEVFFRWWKAEHA